MTKIYGIKELDPHSLSWLKVRMGKPTASEFDQLLTPEFKPRTGEMRRTYIYKKVAELWRGEPLPQFMSWQMEQGNITEEEAIPYYTLETGRDTHPVSFIENGRCGCTPDALVGDDGGLEIKCPEAHTHVKYLMDGVVPKDYVTQVQGCLFVTGRKWWDFMSYRRRFPMLLVRVERDETIMAKIGTALDEFYTAFDEAIDKLKSLCNK